MHAMSPAMNQCLQACQECHVTCLSEALGHCLPTGGPHAAPAHFTLMLDCAAICATAADFMARQSPHHALVCRACADICRACADSCQRVGGMDACAAVCRKCAEHCETMAAMA